MTDKPQRPKHPKPLPPGPQFPGALRSPPHSTEPLPKPPIPRPRMAEGYQPKFPPGVDIEKVKANPPRGGSGARKKPTGMNDEQIKKLARETAKSAGIAQTGFHWQRLAELEKAIADAIRTATNEANECLAHAQHVCKKLNEMLKIRNDEFETLKAASRDKACDHRYVHPLKDMTCREFGTPRGHWCAPCIVADMEKK